MPGLIITEFENVEMEPDKGTIDNEKSNQLIEANSKKRYKNLNIGDDDIYIDASKKNIDKSDVKGGVKGGEPRGNELEKINKIQQGDNCKTDNTDVNIIKQEDILQGEEEPPQEDKKKQILGVDPNKCHIADDSGLNEFQKEIIFSAIYFLLLQRENDKGAGGLANGKRAWEFMGRFGYNEKFTGSDPLYPIIFPQELILQVSGLRGYWQKPEKGENQPNNQAWCAKFTTACIFRALIEVDYIPVSGYDGLHVPRYTNPKYNWNYMKNPYYPDKQIIIPAIYDKKGKLKKPQRTETIPDIPSDKINGGTPFIGSAGAMDIFCANLTKGIPGDKNPQPGDIYYRPKKVGGDGSGHVGVVIYYDPKTTELLTIEGNSSNDCKMNQFFKSSGTSPWGKPNGGKSCKSGTVNGKEFPFADHCYFLHVHNDLRIKWKGKSKGLNLTKSFGPYHSGVFPFTDPKHKHLNKLWTNPLELSKNLKGTFWNPGVKGEESDR